ncbi:MAG: glycosyltransferase [bacterium]|nr:glycosyltransferase [Candidatus Limimorpha caballi]
MNESLWIGSYLNDEMAARIRGLGYGNQAAFLSQKRILEGIEKVSGKTFDTIGALSADGYPKGKELYCKKRIFSHAEGATDTLVGFLNIKYLNKMFMGASLAKEVRRQLKSRQSETFDVFIYEMRSACLKAAKAVKEMCPSSRIHLIVPDLPQFMDLNASRLKRMLKALDWRSIKGNMQYIDDYILYAAPMAEYLGLKEGSWMVMEGAISQDIADREYSPPESRQDDRYIVMYSGSIKRGFGIQHLLDAMRLLDDSYELWFTGGGDYADVVKSYAEHDKRIKFYGILPTTADLIKLQMQADMLINMRNPDEPASRYCFPSKLFEYMVSGNPVISCRLGGIPDEYFNYLFEIPEMTAASIAQTIRKVAGMPVSERRKTGEESKSFILTRKNKNVQAQRIIDFVER